MKKYLTCAGLLCLFLSGCSQQSVATSEFYAMNTVMSTQVYADSQSEADALSAAIEVGINTLEQTISRTRSDSDITAINQAQGAWVEVSESTYAVILQTKSYAALTDGAFDPTVATLTDLWGIGTEAEGIPAAEDLQAALETVGYWNIKTKQEGESYFVCLENGAKLDLGGIGKGLAANQSLTTAQALLDDQTTPDMLLMLGGNIVVSGTNPNRESGLWTVGIADPNSPATAILTLSLTDTTVVTSGDYERYFEQDGVRYHHLLDPTTGYPAQSDLQSVTVVHADSMFADAMSTALYVMGLEQAQAFCMEQGLQAVFVTDDMQVLPTVSLYDCATFVGEDAGYTYGG